MEETQLAADCIQGLRDALPPETEVRTREGELLLGDTRVDGWLALTGLWGVFEIPFVVKRRVTPAVLAILGRRLRQDAETTAVTAPQLMVLTEYVSTRQAHTLREGRTAFADMCGNVHLWGEGLYVWVTGNKPQARKRHTPRLMRPAPARVLFTILQDPTRVQAPYRKIAALAGVAPDTARLAFDYLQGKGLLRTWGTRQRALTRFREIVELWTVAYEETLRPKLRPRKHRRGATGPILDLATELQALPPDPPVLLGGEVAAAILTDHLRPTTAVLHTPQADRRDTMRTLRLVPHPDGEVTLLDTFGETNCWTDPLVGGAPMVDPLLVYAELLCTGDDRAHAVAAEIYDQRIAPRFARD